MVSPQRKLDREILLVLADTIEVLLEQNCADTAAVLADTYEIIYTRVSANQYNDYHLA